MTFKLVRRATAYTPAYDLFFGGSVEACQRACEPLAAKGILWGYNSIMDRWDSSCRTFEIREVK